MTGEYVRSTSADNCRVDQTVLSMADLDIVVGGDDPNYHLCSNGTTAGGVVRPVQVSELRGLIGIAD